MRILYWPELHLPYIGGAEVLSGHFLPQLVRRGHEVLVLTSHGDRELPDEEEVEGIPIVRMPFRSALERRDLRAFAKTTRRVADLKRSFHPDLIHIHFSGPTTLFHLQSASASDAAALVTMHHMLSERAAAAGTIGHRTLVAAAHVAGVSTAVVRRLTEIVPAVADRTSVIHNGLLAPEAPPGPPPSDPPVLLAFGRLIPEKGFDMALRAFASLRAHVPGIQMLIAGDGPERARLEALAAELGVEFRAEFGGDGGAGVTFLGWVEPDDVPALIGRSTVVIVPSRFEEPFGLTALQGSQMARPVVATRRGGLPEVVLDGRTGLLVPADDHEAAAGSIRRLLADSELAERLGRAGRERALRDFSIERYTDQYEELYDRLAMGRGTEQPIT